MSTYIKLLNKEDIENENAKQFYSFLEENYGFVPNIVKTIANAPNLLNVFIPLWAEVYKSPSIGQRLRGIIALGTAHSQKCEYCVLPMTQSAKRAGIEEPVINDIANFNYSNLNKKEALILEYTRMLTLSKTEGLPELRKKLKESFSEEQLVNISMAIAMYNFTSRVLKGLDIPLDETVSVKGA